MSPPKKGKGKGKSKSCSNPKSPAASAYEMSAYEITEVENLARKTNDDIKDRYNDSQVGVAEMESFIRSVSEKYDGLLKNINREWQKDSIVIHEDLATIHEWRAIFLYHRLDNKNCYINAYMAYLLRGRVKIAKNGELFYPILAEKFVEDKELEDAIECYELAGGDSHKEKLNELKEKLQQRKEASDYIEQEIAKEEAQKKKAKPYKKAKPHKKVDITKVEVVEKTIEESHKTMSSPKLRNPFEPEAKRLRFTYEFCGVEGVAVVNGSLEHFGKKVDVSLIQATQVQIDKVDELNQLCSEHRNLVTIFHLAREDHSRDPSLLIAEKVCGIEEYFHNEYVGLKGPDPITSQMWWEYIQQKFQLIFGGVIQGLIYLYRSGKVCGDLSFGTFVTTQTGEGRILPSLNPKSMVKNDVKQLIQVMKSVIMFANTKDGRKNDFVVKLPRELVRFFDFLSTNEMEMIPGSFWIDHPYFWTTLERVAFAYRLNKVVKREHLKKDIEGSMEQVTTVYTGWWNILKGPYRKIWEKGQSEGPQPPQPQPKGHLKVKKYEMKVDIIRFYNAVYTRINEYEYREDKKVLSDAQIEADLSNFYPHFYTDMFEFICHYIWEKGQSEVTFLREISNFRFSDSEYI